jgi:predicted RNA-binding protein with PIN domain
MRIVIDGYNLIRRKPELRALDRDDLEAGRVGLASELSTYRAGKGHPITVVFDGADSIHLGGGSEKVAGITIRYSARGQSADQVIQKMCREGQADLIVTGDREIIDVAMKAGVTVVSPDLFWDKVQEEMYRRFKGEEELEEGKRGRGEKGRKLSKEQRKDRSRIEKL